MSQFIHTGFAAGIDDLNRTPTEDASVMLPGIGRAYARAAAPGYYAAAIHTNAISEDKTGHEQLIRQLEQANGFARESVYMGCAGFLNLSYIAAMRPAAAVLFDINPMQTMLWQRVINVMAQAPTFRSLTGYMQHMGAALEQKAFNACGPLILSDQDVEIYKGRVPGVRVRGLFRETYITDSYPWWMADTPEWRWCGQNYHHLHIMAKENAIGALTLNMTDTEGWDQLRDYFSVIGRRVEMLYASNALTFLDKGTGWGEQGRAQRKSFEGVSARENFAQVARGAQQFVINEHASPVLVGHLRSPQPV